MTIEEAISILEQRKCCRECVADCTCKECDDAFDMAIKALEQEPNVGHWERTTDKAGHLVWECKCGWQQRFATNYCPDCGSKNV